MFVMTSRCFDGLLQRAVTAPALSKPNPAGARHQVSEMGAKVPLAWYRKAPHKHPLTGSRGDSICTSPSLPALIFHRKGPRDGGQAQSREL